MVWNYTCHSFFFLPMMTLVCLQPYSIHAWLFLSLPTVENIQSVNTVFPLLVQVSWVIDLIPTLWYHPLFCCLIPLCQGTQSNSTGRFSTRMLFSMWFHSRTNSACIRVGCHRFFHFNRHVVSEVYPFSKRYSRVALFKGISRIWPSVWLSHYSCFH